MASADKSIAVSLVQQTYLLDAISIMRQTRVRAEKAATNPMVKQGYLLEIKALDELSVLVAK